MISGRADHVTERLTRMSEAAIEEIEWECHIVDLIEFHDVLFLEATTVFSSSLAIP